MKVLQVAHSVYPLAQAGTEIYTAELARVLTKSGIKVQLAIPSYAVAKVATSAQHGLSKNVQVIPMSPGGRWGNKGRMLTLRRPLWQEGLRRLTESFEPDVVHVQHAIGFGPSLLRLFGEMRLPLVVTLPDYWLLCEGILRQCGGDYWKCATLCSHPPPYFSREVRPCL